MKKYFLLLSIIALGSMQLPTIIMAEQKAETTAQPPLLEAAKKGDLNEVKRLIEQDKVDVNVKNQKRKTALMKAARSGHLDIVKYLIDKGADINAEEETFNWTPLLYAVASLHLPIVEYLIEKGAKANYDKLLAFLLPDTGAKALPLIDFFIKHGARVDQNVLERALMFNNDLGVIEYLIKHGGAQVINLWNAGTNSAALNTAIFFGPEPKNIEIIKYLIKSGADINAKDHRGWTPIMSAAFWGHLEIINYLIEKGADLFIKNNDGETALDLAIGDSDNQQAVELLKQKMAEKPQAK